MSHNIPDGGWQRDYYDYVTGGEEGPDVDAELDLESLAETERPSDDPEVA